MPYSPKIPNSRLLTILLAGILLFGSKISYGQASISDSVINITLIDISYGGYMTGGDMADRFGFTNLVGITAGHKFSNNIYLMIGWQFLFNSEVREKNILDAVLTDGGLMIADNGTLTTVSARGFGFTIPFTVGKIFPLSFMSNRNSGLYVEVGAQYMQHLISLRAQDDEAAQLSKKFRKGYDRFTSGIGIKEGIGIRVISNNGYFNMTFGLDFSQNFTKNRRPVNADTGLKDDKTRLDNLIGFRIAWTFPIYSRSPNKVYYN